MTDIGPSGPDDTRTLTARRPYLVRAMIEWMCDNGLTPHLLVDTSGDHVQVPPGYAKDGKLVLNVAPAAVMRLDVGNDFTQFDARFSGRVMSISFPTGAVLAVYARENGEGMMFDGADMPSEPPEPPASEPDPAPERPEGRQRGHLKVVK